jgi:enoyl-CoA hydratase
MDDVVLIERSGRVATVLMNRPEVRNAQDSALIDALDTAMRECEADPDVHVIVLAGNGPSFSSGHDLKELVGGDDPSALRRRRETPEGRWEHEETMYFDKCMAIHDLSKPTIARVHGHCVAAGFMLACMCDLIVASENAVFQNPVVRMTGAGVELLVEPWELGIRKAKEFLFTGDQIDAHEAWRLGLVNRVVPVGRLEEETLTLAKRIAAMPPTTVSLVKRSINKAADLMGKRDSLDYHFAVHQFAHDTATARNALEARKKASSMKEVFSQRDEGF